MSENGPFFTTEHPLRKLGDGTSYGFYTTGPGLPVSAHRGHMSWNDADAFTHDMNMAWHSRDQELAAKDARIKELEAERDTLEAYTIP